MVPKVKTTRRPLRSVLYYMKGNESTTALTPVQLPARSKILQASIQLIKIQIRCDQKGLTLKFIYSEKATKFCEIFTNYLSYVLPVK